MGIQLFHFSIETFSFFLSFILFYVISFVSFEYRELLVNIYQSRTLLFRFFSFIFFLPLRVENALDVGFTTQDTQGNVGPQLILIFFFLLLFSSSSNMRFSSPQHIIVATVEKNLHLLHSCTTVFYSTKVEGSERSL